jgi:hypothetical protein
LVDQVPGPTIRARVGDRIRFPITNRSDEQEHAFLPYQCFLVFRKR